MNNVQVHKVYGTRAKGKVSIQVGTHKEHVIELYAKGNQLERLRDLLNEMQEYIPPEVVTYSSGKDALNAKEIARLFQEDVFTFDYGVGGTPPIVGKFTTTIDKDGEHDLFLGGIEVQTPIVIYPKSGTVRYFNQNEDGSFE